MVNETVSEEDFLIAELAYTLDQMGVQLRGMSLSLPAPSSLEHEALAIVAAMAAREAEWQARWTALLREAEREMADPGVDAVVAFRKRRERSLAMLRGASQPWTDRLTGLTRELSALDRASITQLADVKRAWLDRASHLSDPSA